MPKVEIYLSKGAKAWLKSCHRQPDVLGEVMSDFCVRYQGVADLGELYGANKDQPIKKLEGFADLWEARVRHPTGLYRQFFRFVSIEHRRAAAFVDGAVKKGRFLPRSYLEAVNRRLDTYVAQLKEDATLRSSDRMRSP